MNKGTLWNWIILGLVSLFSIFLLFQGFQTKKNLKQMEQILIGESDRGRAEMEDLSFQLQQTLGAANDVRQMLGLSTLVFSDAEQMDEQKDIDPELEKLEQLDVFYSAVDLLYKTESDYNLSRNFHSYLIDSGLKEILINLNVQLNQTSANSFNLYSGKHLLLSVIWNPESSLFKVQGTDESIGQDELINLIKEDLAKVIVIRDRSSELNTFLRYELLRINEVANKLQERDFKVTWGTGTDWELILLKIDSNKAGRVWVDSQSGSLCLEDQKFQDSQSFLPAFMQYLETLENRSDIDIRDDLAVALIEAAFEDSSFQDYLSSNGYVLSREPREILHDDYRYWDITREDELIGSFALLIGFGELYLLDEDGLPIQSFRGFSENHQLIENSDYQYSEDFEVLSDIYSSKSSNTYLCIGTHEKNADTMILAHANLETNQTLLISIPRDLWYKDRKINSVYRYYGPEALVRELSELTGLKIDGYVSVDMYAFIDIIDIMGGVDIVLEEALIDPNHKIKENGQWTTLNYPAGPLHLEGVGALRVVRSRHTSNDFERAKRQQQIISAMKDKALEMALSSLETLSRFISAAVQYTDTDMGPGELLRLFLKYKNTQINMGNVIDNTNILYTSYSNLYKLSDEEQNEILEADRERVRNGEEAQFNKGAWIVLPKNNDWNLIKWYIRQMIDPSEES